MPMDISIAGDSSDFIIQNTLKKLSAQFFSSLEGGESYLARFESSWSTFGKTLETLRHTLKPETLNLIDNFATTVSTVVSSLLDLETSNCAIYDQFTHDLTKIMDENVEFPPPNTALDASELAGASSRSAYIERSYQWLLCNLHDPYPPKKVRDCIARDTSTPSKDIDCWFIDARKRIGWNSLRKRRFNNKKADIVDAAKSFFLNNNQGHPLEALMESEFAAVQARARDLYTAKFMESTLASKLDVVVKDMTPAIREHISYEKRQKHIERRRRKSERTPSSYPTPDRSPQSSPEPHLHTPELLESVLPLVNQAHCAKRKRRDSVSTSSDERNTERHMKCARVEMDTSAHLSIGDFGLPSPAASVRGDLENIPLVSTNAPALASNPSPLLSAKRKRSFSDAGERAAHKRSHNVQFAPRPQAASNPFPLMSKPLDSLEEWYTTIFTAPPHSCADIPAPVSVDDPDPTSPLEIEICNFAPCLPIEKITNTTTMAWPSLDAHSSIDGLQNLLQAAPSMPPSSILLPKYGMIGLDDNWLNCDFVAVNAQQESMPAFNLCSIDALSNVQESSRVLFEASTLPSVCHGSPPLLSPWTNQALSVNPEVSDPTLFYGNSMPQDLSAVSEPSLETSTVELAISTIFPAKISQREAKARELFEVEAKYLALYAELTAASL